MSNINQFTNKQNIKMLWEVLLDELHVNTSNKTLISNVRTVFESNINPFSLRANHKSNIMELNKQFLSQVVLAVNRLFPNIKQEQTIKRITISDEEVSDPYRIEDIHASRQTEFEKEVEQKRMEMDNYMTPQKPRELDFSDRNSDGKIKAMDSLVADKMTQRNMEIEQFQNNNYNNLSIDPDKWLKSTETSVKTEKTVIEQKPIITNNPNSRLKHISIDNNNNITLSINETEQKSKKVSWDDSHEIPLNIFSKLKKQPVIETNINDNSDNIQSVSNVEYKSYVEQYSMPLPHVKPEEIIRNQVTLPTLNNEPIIPKTEIIKQLNDMNKKIDNLYEMIYKLTSLIEKNNSTDFTSLQETQDKIE